MRLTHAQLITATAVELADSGYEDYKAADLPTTLADALIDLSRRVSGVDAYIVKEILLTTASKDLNISGITNLIEIPQTEGLEYPVDEDPKSFHNHKQYYSGMLTMEKDTKPEADETVYLYCKKYHKVPNIADLEGKATTGYAAGVSTINVDELTASKTLEADLLFTITSDSTGTVYRLTKDTVLSAGGVGDITFTPVLAEAIANNDVLIFENSTLTPVLERYLVRLTAALATISKAQYNINQVPKGGAGVWQARLAWGKLKREELYQELGRNIEMNIRKTYSRL